MGLEVNLRKAVDISVEQHGCSSQLGFKGVQVIGIAGLVDCGLFVIGLERCLDFVDFVGKIEDKGRVVVGLRQREAFLIERVSKGRNPILYWCINGMWAWFGLWTLYADLAWRLA